MEPPSPHAAMRGDQAPQLALDVPGLSTESPVSQEILRVGKQGQLVPRVVAHLGEDGSHRPVGCDRCLGQLRGLRMDDALPGLVTQAS